MTKESSIDFFADSGLTHSQVQIWTGQQVHPESAFCNMTFVIVINGPIDPQTFSSAWQEVIDQSDSLRTFIESSNGYPLRKLNEAGSCQTKILDFSTKPKPKAAFYDWAKIQCSKRLPLDGELIDSYLVNLSEDQYGWYLNQHHLVTDASSTILLFAEVSEKYKQLKNPDPESETTIPSYYETTESIHKKTERSRPKAIQHWQEKASGKTRVNTIYGKRGDTNTTSSTRIEYSLTKEESDLIRALSQEPEFSSFFPDISIYAVFSTLLSAFIQRTTGQSLVSFDSPATNRPTAQSKKSFGCFIEMFPIDIQVDSSDTFRSLGERCMIEIREFLQNASSGTSSPSGSQSSNVVLNYFPQSFGTFADFPIEADWIGSGHIDGVYDLKLQVHDYNATGCYTLQFDVNDVLFDDYDQERMRKHFHSLLTGLIHEPGTKIGALPILTKEEINRTLIDYNKTNTIPIPTDTVFERFAKHSENTPDKIALREHSRTVTYARLLDEVETIATSLQKLGAKPNAVIAVILPRSIDAVIAILAVMRSGAAYLPIDPNVPAGRLTKIITDAKPLCIIGTDLNLSRSDLPDSYTLKDLQTEAENSEFPFPNPKDLAYVIYTSGSTGQPKGVEIEHCGLIDYIDWAERMYIRGETLCYPLITSLSFDLTVTSLFLPLITGGELIVYPTEMSEVDSAVINVINDNKVDFVKLTPSHLSLLQQLDLSHSRIKKLVLGGEDLRMSLANSITKQFSHEVELYNEYGPTECVVGCMIHELGGIHYAENETSVPIGAPADHVSLQLLNEQKVPVPEGTPGELHITRNGLARGYRNDSEKTRKHFFFLNKNDSQRTYKTGDLARFSSKGCMTYLGRVDNQVKISGHRIELGEIENALLQHPNITQVYLTTHSPKSFDHSLEKAVHCKRCGLSSHYPNVIFNQEGVCGICQSFESIKEEASAYFQTPQEFQNIFDASRLENNPKYDCMVFYSGGKDSSYALARLVDMGLKVYAFTLDNGYLSEQAMSNISRVVETLEIDHEFATTPSMNEIFRDSLTRFSNVCNGCFKTIYTLGMNRACELEIPIIVTGLSRGQFFETRLTENLFRNEKFRSAEVDAAVLEARKRYHKTQDATTRCLDTSNFKNDQIFDEIQFVDFYRYIDVSLEEIYSYLERRLPWIRPSDTGRSTNCLVNDVGIYIHKKERGFHNYALPYSWDVRLGHKQRDEALEELNDKYELSDVRRMLSEIGYDEDRLVNNSSRKELIAYYEASAEIDFAEFSSLLNHEVPPQMQPRRFIRVEKMPLTINGKIDQAALPVPQASSATPSKNHTPPEGPVQEHVFDLWAQALKRSSFCIHDSFFQLGGNSLSAMEITLQLCQDFEIDLSLQSIFKYPTVAQLSAVIEETILGEIENLTDEEASDLLANSPDE